MSNEITTDEARDLADWWADSHGRAHTGTKYSTTIPPDKSSRLFAWVREWLADYVRKSEEPLRALLDEDTISAYLSTPTVERERGSIAYSLAVKLRMNGDYAKALALVEAAERSS